MFSKLVDAIKSTVKTITAADAEDEMLSQSSQGTQNYGTYDLSDIFPFRMFTPNPHSTLREAALKLGVPVEKLKKMNELPESYKEDEPLGDKKLVVEDGWGFGGPQFTELTVGDLLSFDFEKIAENSEPPIFYVHYATVRGDALGKLILTDFEILFEPLNSKLKGFINQDTEDYFQNRKLGMSISYRDLLETIDVVRIPDRLSKDEKISTNYFLELQVYNTGNYLQTDEYTRNLVDSCQTKGLPLARVYMKINNSNLLNVKLSEESKAQIANKIIVRIKEKRAKFLEKEKKEHQLSQTKIPFFDIDFKTMLRIINKDSKEQLSAQREVQLLQQNLHLFEKFFGFDFGDQRGLSRITNQSLNSIENVYPSIKAFTESPSPDALLLMADPAKAPSVDNYFKARLLADQGFNILAQKSSIISSTTALLVNLSAR